MTSKIALLAWVMCGVGASMRISMRISWQTPRVVEPTQGAVFASVTFPGLGLGFRQPVNLEKRSCLVRTLSTLRKSWMGSA